jgi:hypothetical protein
MMVGERSEAAFGKVRDARSESDDRLVNSPLV